MQSQDQGKAFDLDAVRTFVEALPFRTASTVPEAPHQYCLRRWLSPGDQARLDRLLELVARHGYSGPFWGATWRYLDVSPWKYWQSYELFGDGTGVIINRARIDSGQLRLEVGQ